MGLFTEICCPALQVVARMERRGVPLDVGVRDALRAKTRAHKERAEAEVERLTVEAWERRRALVAAAIERLEKAKEGLVYDGVRCFKHPGYEGLTKRAKCAGCVEVGEAARSYKKQRDDLARRIRKGKDVLERIGPSFVATNDHHWRWLLFDKDGLGLKALGTTESGMPSVDDDTIIALQKKNPDVEVLRWRVAAKRAEARLTRRLNVEPDANGRVHFRSSLHGTWYGRLSSGLDQMDEDKVRRSAGNSQNIPKPDRVMYVAPPGFVWVEPDYSQIEAKVQAWIARDLKMLAAFRDGLDIHAMTAAAIWKVPEKETKTRLVMFMGERKPMREAAKRRRHGGNYGMKTRGFATRFGIPMALAVQIDAADREMWPRLYQFQNEEVATINRDGALRNPFGRLVRFWKWRQEDGRWVTAERETGLAYRPASTTADIAKAIMPALDAFVTGLGGELNLMIHDGFPCLVPEGRVSEFVSGSRPIFEREWPQMGYIEGFGYFWCKVDYKVGRNLAPYHVCDAARPERCDEEYEWEDGRCAWYNLEGLRDFSG